MELMQAIYTRRSVRAYKPDAVPREIIEELLSAAVQAPTAMNIQPWAFGVITGVDGVRQYADRAKDAMMAAVGDQEWVAPFKERMAAPGYSMFYGAPALIVIYAKPMGPVAELDCHLAAENLMLAACDKGLGSCWIGFATWFLDSPEAKAELGVPSEYKMVAPIVVGHPVGPVPPVEPRLADVLFWRSDHTAGP
jgi:nitroreductase